MMQIPSLLGPSAPTPSAKRGLFSKPQTAPSPVGSGLFVATEPLDRLERSATQSSQPASLPAQAPASSRSSAQTAALAALPAPLSAAFAHVFSVLESAPEGQAQLLELLAAQKLTQQVLERLCDQFLYKTQYILVPAAQAQGYQLPPEDVAWGRTS